MKDLRCDGCGRKILELVRKQDDYLFVDTVYNYQVNDGDCLVIKHKCGCMVKIKIKVDSNSKLVN